MADVAATPPATHGCLEHPVLKRLTRRLNKVPRDSCTMELRKLRL